MDFTRIKYIVAGCGGEHLYRQHSGGRGRGKGRHFFVSFRPNWFTEQVPGQPGLHRKDLSQKTQTNKQTRNKIPAFNKTGSYVDTRASKATGGVLYVYQVQFLRRQGRALVVRLFV